MPATAQRGGPFLFLSSAGGGAALAGAGSLIVGTSGVATTQPRVSGTGSLSINGSAVLTTTALYAGTGSLSLGGTATLTPAGLELLFDAQYLSAADGAAVATLPDSSGKGNHLTQATGSQQGLYRASGINGLPAIDLDGSNDRYVSPSMFDSSWDTAFTLYAVVERETGTTTQTVVGTAANAILGQLDTAVPPLSAEVRASDAGPCFRVANASLSGPVRYLAATFAQKQVLTISYDGATFAVAGNGEENAAQGGNFNTGADATGNLGLTGALTLGATAAGTSVFNGRVAYLAVYKAAHSRARRLAQEAALRTRFGVTPIPAVFFAGDSITAGSGASFPWPSRAATLMAERAALYNRAIGGTTSQQWVDTLLAERVLPFYLADRSHNIAVLMIGTNDADSLPFYDNMAELCTTLQSAGWTVAICTLAPTGVSARPVVNGAIKANWATFADALIDMTSNAAMDSSPTAADDTGNLTYYQGDGTHLNDEGYRQMALVGQPVLDVLLGAVVTVFGRRRSSGSGNRRQPQ